jgi:hypothetical protein
MRGYLIYFALVLTGFALWALLFAAMRRTRDEKRTWVYFLIGPLHAYLMRRGYTLSQRELFGWGLVLLFMLLAPWITDVLER